MADSTFDLSALPKSVLNFKTPFGSDTLATPAPTRQFGPEAPVSPPVSAAPRAAAPVQIGRAHV